MASCHKCGKRKIKKRADGLRWCPHCGAMPGIPHAERSGLPTTNPPEQQGTP